MVKKLLLAIALAASPALAADSIIGTNGQTQLVDNAGVRWNAKVAYTTNGLGDVYTLGGLVAADNYYGDNVSGNHLLLDNAGRKWDLSVIYTTDGAGNVVPVSGGAGSGITSLNGLNAATQTFAVGTGGSDFGISSATSTHTFNLPTASATKRGALSSADWSTFNGKESPLTFNAPLSRSTNSISCLAASGSQAGCLSSVDWSTFNAKEPAVSAGTTSQYYRGDKSMQTLDTSAVPENGNLYYTSARFNTAFSAKSTTDLGEGSNLYYTDARARAAHSGTSPITYNSGTGAIGCQAASGSQAGCLASADWSTFNAKEPAITAGSSSQVILGDKTLGNTTTAGAASSIAKFDANGNLNIAGDRAIEDPRYAIHVHSDFIGYLDVWDPGKDASDTRGCSGTGCSSIAAGGYGSVIDNAHPGIARLGTGTTTTGNAWMGGGNTMVFGGGTTRLEWLMYHPALSDGTNTYKEAMGYVDSFSAASDCTTNGLFVTYTDSENSGNFVLHACDNAVKVTSNCSFGPDASAWTRYDLTTNAAGTTASFQKNDGTACTISSSVPHTQGRNTVLGYWSIIKSAGTSDRQMNLDYADFYMKMTTPR